VDASVFHCSQELLANFHAVWNDFEFYNLVGFYVYFNDSMDEVVHIQAWTLGIGETVRNFLGLKMIV
jgi:hypothetical protein